MNSVGDRVKKLRNERGMTQSELGAALNVAQTTISEIERGGNDPSLPVLRALADFFGVRPGYFLDDQPTQATANVGAS